MNGCWSVNCLTSASTSTEERITKHGAGRGRADARPHELHRLSSRGQAPGLRFFLYMSRSTTTGA